MNVTSSSTDQSVPHGACLTINNNTESDIPTVSLWNHHENIDALKAKMRLKLGQEGGPGPSAAGCTVSPIIQCKTPVGQELSLSLPNLSDNNVEQEPVKECDKTTRSSLSDIYNEQSVVTNGSAHSEHWSPMSELCHMADLRRSSLDGCSTCTSDGLLAGSSKPPKCLKQRLAPKDNTDGLKVMVDETNSCLSAVLENMPLIYIPHTKQLISLEANHSVRKSDRYGDHQGDSCLKSPLVNTVGVFHNNNFLASSVIDDYNAVNLCSNSAGDYNDQAVGFDSFVNGLDRDNSILSQDSDASSTCRSEGTVICNNEKWKGDKDAKSVDFDDVSLDRLSKLSADRDSPRNSIQRNNTFGSLSRTDASSFSSISSISTGTDFSVSAASCSDDFIDTKGPPVEGEEGFTEINLHSRNSYERSRNSSQDSGIDEKATGGAKPKRRGITSFLTRNLFSRKAKDPADSDSVPGYKLFGRVPPKDSPQKDPSQISEEYQLKSKPGPDPSSIRVKNSDIEVSSTTALILEQRPQGLPSKDPNEELRHRQEYEAMVEAAKKRELREAKARKKLLRQQLRLEHQMTTALETWTSEILPNWETTFCTKKTRDLWWLGIPPSVRGRVWQLAIGNELNLTPELYEICHGRAKDIIKLINESGDSDGSSQDSTNKESSVDLIKLDVSRTFPQLCIFQKGGPYHDLLQGLLGAYVCYRPDVGYVQGMSFIAAVLLLNMEVADAFICFSNLLNRPCQIAFFRLDEGLMKAYFQTYEEFFQESLPRLFAHFQKQNVTPDLYIIDWMFSLYAKSLPLDVASRVWDIFARDGEEFLFRTALGILRLFDETLLGLDFIHLAQFLTKLPENLCGEKLFRCIDRVHMTIDNRKFKEVLSSHRETKDT